MSNGKDTIICLRAELIKKTKYKWIDIPKPKSLVANVNVELDLSNYATKANLKKCNGSWYVIFCWKVRFSKLKN